MSLQKLSFYFFSLLLLCALLAIFMPATSMPEAGLDPSWHLTMNHAIAENLAIGKDIIFTFGPYASLYTHEFNPATYQLNLVANFYLTICYFTAAIFLMQNVKVIWLALFWAVIAIIGPADPIFFSFTFLAFLSAFRLTNPQEESFRITTPNWLNAILVFVIFSPLGFLPLIKGSFILLCFAAIGGSVLMFCERKKFTFAAIAILSPIISMLFFWKFAGQEIPVLKDYFVNMLQIISGYNEAMSESSEKSRNIVAFLSVSSVILFFLGKQRIESTLAKIMLIAMTASFLFVSFKGGFVRHGGEHPAIQSTTPLIITLLLPSILTYSHSFLFSARNVQIAFIPLLAFISWIVTSRNIYDLKPQRVFDKATNQYGIISSVKSAIFNRESFEKSFEKRIEEISHDYYLPQLSGTSDIYPFDQSSLIASGNNWSPRPIFQSYSSYTPKLLQLNAEHLLGAKAPDNIFFKVRAIDERINSLDDGVSWPIILQNYHPTSTYDEFLILKRQATEPAKIEKISSQEHKLGEEVIVPEGGIIFSEFEIKPSFLGSILAALFKPSQLEITVTLVDGSRKNYRIHSVTAKTGFLISPLIENTPEFTMLYNAQNILSDKTVKSFNINERKKKHFRWNKKYHVTFSKIKSRSDSSYKFKPNALPTFKRQFSEI